MDPEINSQNNFIKEKTGKDIYIISFVILILVFVGVVFFKTGFSFEKKELNSVKVRLSWVHQAQFAGLYMAKEKGFYEDVNLDVEILPFEFNIDQPLELAREDVQFSIMSLDEFVLGASYGKISAVASIYKVNPFALVALEESNIKTPADFEGKVLGNAGSDLEGDIAFKTLLNIFDIKEGDVEFKKLGFETAKDLKTKEADVIDLYRIDQTYLLDKEGIKYTLIKPELYGLNSLGDIIVVNKDFFEKNSDIVRKFVNATVKGWDYAIDNIDESVKLSFDYAQGEYKDIDYQRHILEKSIPLIEGSDSRLGKMDENSFLKSFNTLRSSGVLESDYNILDFVEFDLVN